MREWLKSESLFISAAAAAANSEGPVSCLISHKTTVSKWAGLAASSKHMEFLLSLFHNRLTRELTVRDASSSLVGQEIKEGMNPSCLSTTSSFLANLFSSISNPHKWWGWMWMLSGPHSTWERRQRKKEINIWCKTGGRDQTAQTHECRGMRGKEWRQQIPLYPCTNYAKRGHSSSFKAILSNFQVGQSQRGHGHSSASCCP